MHAVRWQLCRLPRVLRIGTISCEARFQTCAWKPLTQEGNHEQIVHTIDSFAEAPLQGTLFGSWIAGQRRTSWDRLWNERRGFSSPASKPGLNKDGLFEIPLAQTGEGIAECEVLSWNVKEGQEVQQFDLLCEVQSDKASVEITSRYAGTIRKIYFQPGDIVKVGEILCDLNPPGGQTQPPKPTEEPALVAAHKATISETASTADAASTHAPGGSDGASRHKASASPAVRALAKEYGLDLGNVVGTGPEGRVLKGDVLRFVAVSQGVEETREAGEVSEPPETAPDPDTRSVDLEATGGLGATAQPAGVPASEGDRVIPLRGYRRAMAKSMTAANEVPHFTFCEEIDMDRLVALRGRLQAAAAAAAPGGADVVKVTYMPLIMKALSAALREFPEVNATVNSDATELSCRASHNIGVAMATPHGLVVPNVKNCQDLTVKQIAEEMQRLQGLAKAGRLPDHDLKEGTITVSNVGTIGGTYATPLINLPEVAIVALGKVQTLPRYRGGELRPVSVMQVSWSADHRVIDGASIASFCQAWKRYLEAPDTLLLHLR